MPEAGATKRLFSSYTSDKNNVSAHSLNLAARIKTALLHAIYFSYNRLISRKAQNEMVELLPLTEPNATGISQYLGLSPLSRVPLTLLHSERPKLYTI